MAVLNYLLTSICFKHWDIPEDFLSVLWYTPSFHSPSEGPVYKPVGHQNTFESGFVKHQLNSLKQLCLTDILLFRLLYCRRWKTQFPFGLTCSNFAALAKRTAELITWFLKIYLFMTMLSWSLRNSCWWGECLAQKFTFGCKRAVASN